MEGKKNKTKLTRRFNEHERSEEKRQKGDAGKSERLIKTNRETQTEFSAESRAEVSAFTVVLLRISTPSHRPGATRGWRGMSTW